MYSDNGTNFFGARRSLDEMQQLLTQHKDHVENSLADEGIQWTFIPPRAPHWGGKWESAVRCVKLHLRRVIGSSTLTHEQMRTLLAQISAVVNSRTLCYTSDTDSNYLSPAHFLIGRAFKTFPEADLGHIPKYLTSLQQRPKWTKATTNIKIGSVVLVKESNTLPASWHLAWVIETYPGRDNIVRAVRLKMASGEFTRPIT
ncbi:uncharacterized protein [Drosophila bipectinata]|uniref:uncharacterized protein n=1 Tax=Drosophila bipectinata TaxID=42026 RepID=UPI001C89867D|nr:uncharacterized protein LOC122321450 [Drosophila bipectinata]